MAINADKQDCPTSCYIDFFIPKMFLENQDVLGKGNQGGV